MIKDSAEHLYTYNSANQLIQEDITGPIALPITVIGTASDANGIQSVTVNGSSATLDGNNFSCQINLSPGQNTITVSATDVAGNTTTTTLHVTYSQTNQILYLYDNNGNLIRKQSLDETLNLAYDYENRLTSITSTGMDISYSYDGEGRRISKTDNQNTTNYLYDGMDVILEQSPDGITTYTRNPYAAGGIGGIISSQQGTAPETYYSYDGLGSVVNLTDSTGANTQSYAYDAFGNTFTQPNPNNNRQFLTKEQDPSGLIYFGARYYDPTIGRFITQDPLGMIDGPNVYVYCSNSPVNLVDPYGFLGEKEIRAELDKYFGDKLSEETKKKVSDYIGKYIGIFNGNALQRGDLKAKIELEKTVRRSLEKADESTKKAFEEYDNVIKQIEKEKLGKDAEEEVNKKEGKVKCKN